MSTKGFRHDTNLRRNRKVVLATQEYCYLCGLYVDKTTPKFHPLAPEVDHIIPLALGGHVSELSNLALTHRFCNGLKHDKPLGVLSKSFLSRNVTALSTTVESSGVDFLALMQGDEEEFDDGEDENELQ